jgi:hypothetical protein
LFFKDIDAEQVSNLEAPTKPTARNLFIRLTMTLPMTPVPNRTPFALSPPTKQLPGFALLIRFVPILCPTTLANKEVECMVPYELRYVRPVVRVGIRSRSQKNPCVMTLACLRFGFRNNLLWQGSYENTTMKVRARRHAIGIFAVIIGLSAMF